MGDRMSKQPNPTDYIELWVEDDGDTILCKRQEPGEQNGPADEICFPTSNLCYGINELEELASELNSYGCDKEAIKKAILKVSFENYNEEVTVK
jgi:hypothetical protein